MKFFIVATLLFLSVFCLSEVKAEQSPPALKNDAHCFEFQSSMWMNLHHHLYQLAKPKKQDYLQTYDVTFSSSEQQTLEVAVDFYKKNYVEQSLLFNPLLGDIKAWLSHQPDNKPLNDKKLPSKLVGHLNATSAIYQKYYWADHNQENTRWIANTQKLLTTHASSIRNKLAAQFDNPLCQSSIRFDIVAPHAHWAGAYTTTTPGHVVITSSRSNNQKRAALEISFHEAAHVNLLDTMKARLTAIEKAGNYPHERDLWHAILFYTVGEAVKQSYLANDVNDYQPYAYKHGLYQRAWSKYEPLIVKHWQPYMDNQTTMKVALTAILDGLRSVTTGL